MYMAVHKVNIDPLEPRGQPALVSADPCVGTSLEELPDYVLGGDKTRRGGYFCSLASLLVMSLWNECQFWLGRMVVASS